MTGTHSQLQFDSYLCMKSSQKDKLEVADWHAEFPTFKARLEQKQRSNEHIALAIPHDAAFYSLQGKRGYMEDRGFIIPAICQGVHGLDAFFSDAALTASALYAVFDGHAGSRCADFLVAEFGQIFRMNLQAECRESAQLDRNAKEEVKSEKSESQQNAEKSEQILGQQREVSNRETPGPADHTAIKRGKKNKKNREDL